MSVQPYALGARSRFSRFGIQIREREGFITGQVRELLGGTARHIGAHTSLVVLGLDSLGTSSSSNASRTR
ncbi:hypothetical protein [Streptacidiphilus sp. EB103A]|uniref:hypothetical protein n=1 Tax=Streptacidiphilus sp. EB103A TaxID=3156275 RepID=UPI0035164B40